MNPGSFTKIRYPSVIFNGLICLILLLFFAGYFVDLGRELTFIVMTLLLLAITIFVLQFKQLLLYGLSFLIPLSVPMQVFGNAVISVPSEMICVLFSGFFFIKLVLDKKLDANFLFHPVTILVLCDLSWLLISSFFSQMPEVSIKRFIIRLCYYVTFYYFYFELFKQDVGNIKKVFTLHVLGFLIPVAYSFFNHARLGFTTVGSQRISAPFYYDHTIYGACLVFFIPFLIYYSFNGTGIKERIFYSCLLAVFIIAATLSYSRAAWASLVIAITINLMLKYRIKYKYLVYISCVIFLTLILNWQKIIVSVKENKEISHSNNVGMHLKSISNVNTDASNKERINRWKCALRMFADKPLTGFGPGTYQFFYGQYQQREDMTRISTYNGTKGHAHSEYLNYLSETGLPGLVIFLCLITTVSYKCLLLYRKSKEQNTKMVSLFIITGLITYFIHAFFNGFLEFDKMAMPVFSSYAAITFLDLDGHV